VTDPLHDFVQGAESILRRPREPRETVLAVQPLLQRLVTQRGWLNETYRREIPSKPYAQYLLYRPPDFEFSIVSFVWNPGHGSPVHDHCTWGVIGQYEGEEEETRFRQTASGLERVTSICAHPGDVSHVYPPDRDLHQIINTGSVPAISIHIYGGDIGSQQRYRYDLQTGEKRLFISGYDAAQ